MHVGVDNLNVVRHVSRIIDGRCTSKPFSLVDDGDLLLQIQQLVFWRGVANAAVSKVKGHADEGLVALGRVREVDRLGNNEADAAAALGRRRVHHSVASARRMVTRSCAHWYPVARELHRFFIAIARSVLNDDGMSGTTLHPVVWSAAANPKRRSKGIVTSQGCLVLFTCGFLIGITCLLLVLARVILLLGLFLFVFC